MSDKQILHATALSVNGCGVLLSGQSGSGKSDMALRLIENHKAALIADDMVCVEKIGQRIYAQAPQNIAGLLEVRNVGLVKYPYLEKAEINLCVRLVDKADMLERMPEIRTEEILGLEIKQIDLYAKENSAPEKLVAAIRYLRDHCNKEED